MRWNGFLLNGRSSLKKSQSAAASREYPLSTKPAQTKPFQLTQRWHENSPRKHEPKQTPTKFRIAEPPTRFVFIGNTIGERVIYRGVGPVCWSLSISRYRTSLLVFSVRHILLFRRKSLYRVFPSPSRSLAALSCESHVRSAAVCWVCCCVACYAHFSKCSVGSRATAVFVVRWIKLLIDCVRFFLFRSKIRGLFIIIGNTRRSWLSITCANFFGETGRQLNKWISMSKVNPASIFISLWLLINCVHRACICYRCIVEIECGCWHFIENILRKRICIVCFGSYERFLIKSKYSMEDLLYLAPSSYVPTKSGDFSSIWIDFWSILNESNDLNGFPIIWMDFRRFSYQNSRATLMSDFDDCFDVVQRITCEITGDL